MNEYVTKIKRKKEDKREVHTDKREVHTDKREVHTLDERHLSLHSSQILQNTHRRRDSNTLLTAPIIFPFVTKIFLIRDYITCHS